MMYNNEIGLMLDGFRYDIGRDRQTSHDTTYLCATITNKETYIVPRFRQLQGGNLGKETAEGGQEVASKVLPERRGTNRGIRNR